MGVPSEVTVTAGVWVEAYDATAETTVIVEPTTGNKHLFRFGTSLPSAASFDGHNLKSFEPLAITIPAGEKIYVRTKLSPAGTEVASTLLISVGA